MQKANQLSSNIDLTNEDLVLVARARFAIVNAYERLASAWGDDSPSALLLRAVEADLECVLDSECCGTDQQLLEGLLEAERPLTGIANASIARAMRGNKKPG